MPKFQLKADYKPAGDQPKAIKNWISSDTYETLGLENDNTHQTLLGITGSGKTFTVATVLDLFTRKIVGFAVCTTHTTRLVVYVLMSALTNNPRPLIFHSDNGSEYNSEVFIGALKTIGTIISRSAPGCPWENGYQESFYSQFKVDLGDLSRFKILGELVYEIYQMIHIYNNTRIHCALKMAPVQFAQNY